MKLIIAGSTGFVGTEIIRQAVSNPAITSIMALARRVTAVPENVKPGADEAKLKLIAVTPSGLGKTPWEEVKKICLDYTVTGVETISQLRRDSAGKPLRFIYTSGAKTQRDPTKKPWVLGDYSLLRGEAESYVVDYAKESRGTVEACVVRPGLIVAPGRTGLVMTALQTVGRTIISLPKLDVSEIAAALLDQAIKGFEKDTLLNEDLVRIGRNALAEQQQVS